MKTLIVLPSFNESQNILAMIQAVLDLGSDYRICVVDDSSPDGTSQIVEEAIAKTYRWSEAVHLIRRTKKDGRGSAVREGFAWGMASGTLFDAFVELDCDFSHEPSAIPQGLQLLKAGNDVVIGARYPDGTIIDWPRRRRVLSFLANLLARVLIEWSVTDYTNGFRFYSPRAVRLLLDQPQRYKGYIYLSESLSYLLRENLKVASFSIHFRNRVRGISNTGVKEFVSALWGIFSIALEYRRFKA